MSILAAPRAPRHQAALRDEPLERAVQRQFLEGGGTERRNRSSHVLKAVQGQSPRPPYVLEALRGALYPEFFGRLELHVGNGLTPQAIQILTFDGGRIAQLHGFVRPDPFAISGYRAGYMKSAEPVTMRVVAYNEVLAERVRAALAGRADVEEKKMFGGLSFMVAGQMCCGVLKDELVVRIEPADFDELVAQPHVRPFDFSGRPMQGMVYVDQNGLADVEVLRTWVQRGTDYVAANTGSPKRRQRKSAARQPRYVQH